MKIDNATRRQFLASTAIAGVPTIAPSHVLGRAGGVAASDRVTAVFSFLFGTRPLLWLLPILLLVPAHALDRPDVTYKVFQFPANMIPRIDGNADDWGVVPEDYVVATDRLADSRTNTKPDPKSLDIRVRVAWVKGLNRLYFLYEGYDDFWQSANLGTPNDIFEVVVDADMSGGPLIDPQHKNVWNAEALGAMSVVDPRAEPWELHRAIHGVHAQNYHIFTPAEGRDWAMVWGCQPYIKELPYANAAYNYNFKNGQPGKLVLEFWITPFDYAGCEGPERAVESRLWENKLLGLGWAIIEHDEKVSSFWTLSSKLHMYGNATQLPAFRLMPLEDRFKKPIQSQWRFQVVDMDRRLVAFKDLSEGKVTSWKWDFGDGGSSSEQNPIHAYEKPGDYVVVLTVEGSAGTSRMEKVWDVSLR
jgi:hypothetical protein